MHVQKSAHVGIFKRTGRYFLSGDQTAQLPSNTSGSARAPSTLKKKQYDRQLNINNQLPLKEDSSCLNISFDIVPSIDELSSEDKTQEAEECIISEISRKLAYCFFLSWHPAQLFVSHPSTIHQSILTRANVDGCISFTNAQFTRQSYRLVKSALKISRMWRPPARTGA
jgi:hypothetical protein